MPDKILMARQPIFDTTLKVVAYELLYRSEDGLNPLPMISGEQASSRVILHSYTSIIDRGSLRVLPAFINFSQTMLESDTLPHLSPKEVVIEVLEDCKPTPQLIAALKRLRNAGFRLALDDFSYRPELKPLVELAHIIKLDVRTMTHIQLAEQIERLKPFRTTLLAEKVETFKEYRLCKELGCELFQGFFFSKPELLKGHPVSSNKMILGQLMSYLSRPDCTLEQLKTLIARDPALSFKLLRLTNSAAFGLQHKVSNLHEALVYIGLTELKRWISLIMLAESHGKPSELIRQILLLARFCEQLAETSEAVDSGAAFMAGLLLHMDAMMDMTQTQLLSLLDLEHHLHQALLYREGELGRLLEQVEAFVHGNWQRTDRQASQLQRCYLDSLEWTRESMQLLSLA
ncbi:EAL and HDOD domain-containing protein [Marinobacterium weihaiense]|uniref:HDOD domain-containing protein n=1 Tax=Marinobacterium weihaiense TaxID=2851016 RepID=A0ABS6M6Y7_9GAMM|nr:HDOD domain-containing protein [Marinobacterium weihaiense]MBV0932005.1 HDOD domain-containing protein [Marinobacterium weihaiense]